MDPSQVQNLIQGLQSQINTLTLRLDASAAASTRPKLPHPDKFGGSAQKFDTWLLAIKAKLYVDGPAIGSKLAQFYYVYLNLESNVQAMVLPQLQELDDQSAAEDAYDYHAILDQLSRVYSNPNKVEEAENKLHKLQQGTDSLTAYVSRFERLLYEAKGSGWPEANKIFFFRNGLHQTLRNRLAGQLNLPGDYTSFLKTVQQLAGHSTSFNPSSALVPANGKPTFKPQLPEPMDISALQPTAIVKRPPPSSTANQRQAYELEVANIRDGLKESWEEIQEQCREDLEEAYDNHF
jgi:hypothetical protein